VYVSKNRDASILRIERLYQKVNAVGYFDTSVTLYKSTLCDTPEDVNLLQHCSENLETRVCLFLSHRQQQVHVPIHNVYPLLASCGLCRSVLTATEHYCLTHDKPYFTYRICTQLHFALFRLPGLQV